MVDSQRSDTREMNELNAARLDTRMTGLQREVELQMTGLRHEMEAHRHETRAEIAALRGEVHAGLARLETRLEQRFSDLIKWSFVFWIGVILAGFLRP